MLHDRLERMKLRKEPAEAGFACVNDPGTAGSYEATAEMSCAEFWNYAVNEN